MACSDGVFPWKTEGRVIFFPPFPSFPFPSPNPQVAPKEAGLRSWQGSPGLWRNCDAPRHPGPGSEPAALTRPRSRIRGLRQPHGGGFMSAMQCVELFGPFDRGGVGELSSPDAGPADPSLDGWETDRR